MIEILAGTDPLNGGDRPVDEDGDGIIDGLRGPPGAIGPQGPIEPRGEAGVPGPQGRFRPPHSSG